MIAARSFGGKICGVFGLGMTGISAAQSLLAGGAGVVAWDDDAASREKARRMGVPLLDLYEADWPGIDYLVLSPGVPLTHPEPHPVVKKALEAGVPVIGDAEIMLREIAASGSRLVAITGTNGKSTSTALLGHVLKNAGLDVEIGGNIGTFAVLELAEPREDTIYVIEFSSYQIDLTPSLKPDIAILLNLTPDHIERHGSMRGYAQVKARIFALQGEGDIAIIGDDDDYCREIHAALTDKKSRKIKISQSCIPENGVGVVGGILFEHMGGDIVRGADISRADALRGAHNGQNAAAVYAACRALGLDAASIEAGLCSFPGLEHRMELVGKLGNVLFVNDSKGTNAEAAAKALGSFENIFWIAGGLAKTGGIEPLRSLFSRITRAFLIGEAAEDFAATLKGHVPYIICGDMKTALEMAAREAMLAGNAPVVLLSPACASFDQYPSFAVRGDEFRAMALEIIEKAA